MVKVSLWIGLMMLFVIQLQGQQNWTLQQCIDEAVKNNLDIKLSELDIISKEVNLASAKAARWPNLNAMTTYYESFGRRIDPTTNTFNSQSFGNQQYNLSSDVTLFNFNRINNSIKQAELDVKVSNADMRQLANNVALNIAQAYLGVLLARENLEVARKSREQTLSQLELTDKLIAAGSKSRNARLEIVAQVAQNDAQIITAENNITTNLLNLKQLMMIDPATPFDIALPDIPLPVENPDEINFEQLVEQAIKTQPQFEASAKRIESSMINEKAVAAQGLPSIAFSGSMASNYSTLNQKLAGYEPVTSILPNVTINGQSALVTYQDVRVLTEKNPYGAQINENLGYGLGIGLRIPIYNNRQVKSAVQMAKINTESLQIRDRQARQAIRTEIMQALNDAKAAKRTLEASERSHEALEAAYNDTQKRFEIGNTNTFELITSRNNLDNAKRNLLINKYDYTFKMKILDFYAGKILGF